MNIQLNWTELVKEAVRRRKQQGLTQKEFSILVNLSHPTINSFEQGRTTPTLQSCFKILRFLDLIEDQNEILEQMLIDNLKTYEDIIWEEF